MKEFEVSRNPKNYNDWEDGDIFAEINRRLMTQGNYLHFGHKTGIQRAMMLADLAPGYYLQLRKNFRIRGEYVWSADFLPDNQFYKTSMSMAINANPARAICIAWLKWHDARGSDDS